MSLYIIDNKRIDMTQDEYMLYTKIVKSYTVNNNRGEDLFMDLFETDKKGLIKFLIPPSKRQTSFEVWLFLMALQQQQQLREMRKLIDNEIIQIRDKLDAIEK